MVIYDARHGLAPSAPGAQQHRARETYEQHAELHLHLECRTTAERPIGCMSRAGARCRYFFVLVCTSTPIVVMAASRTELSCHSRRPVRAARTYDVVTKMHYQWLPSSKCGLSSSVTLASSLPFQDAITPEWQSFVVRRMIFFSFSAALSFSLFQPGAQGVD